MTSPDASVIRLCSWSDYDYIAFGDAHAIVVLLAPRHLLLDCADQPGAPPSAPQGIGCPLMLDPSLLLIW
jgi:hypothetical protein